MVSDGAVHVLSVTESGERIDRYVAEQLAGLSRTAVQRLVDGGEITVNGEQVSASARLRSGDEITVRVPQPQPVSLQAEAIPLAVVYEDHDLLVIDKVPGIVVHPGAGHASGTLVNAVLAHCPDLSGVGGELRPGIVHRLDRDTSGLLVVAKHDAALLGLQRQFKNRTVRKCYTALAVGRVLQVDGLIEAPIARDRRHRRRMAVRSDGKLAQTRWHVTARYRDDLGGAYTLLDVRLLTGRTHQIRVHLSWMGFPLVGDGVYGRESATLPARRQFLHARELAFEHPMTGERLTFSAPLPDDLRAVLGVLTMTDQVPGISV